MREFSWVFLFIEYNADLLFRFIAKKDEETVSLLFSAILLLFKSYRSYELFLDLSQTQQTALLSCMTMKRRHVDEQALVPPAGLHRLRSRQLQDGSQHHADPHQFLWSGCIT